MKYNSQFCTDHKQYEKQNGQKYKIVRKCDHKTFPYLKGFLDYVYIIRTEDGSIIMAYPSEVEK